MKVTVNAKSRKTLIEIGKSSKKIEKGIRNAFYEIGKENQRYLQRRILAKDKTGKIYPYKGGSHRASAPGEFPANRSGNLRKSVGYVLQGSSSLEFGVEAEYGKYLEEGTKHIKPRKLVGETAREKQRDAVNAFLKHTDKEIKK